MLCKLGSKGPPSFLSTPRSAASVTHEPTARKPGETILAARKSTIMLPTRTRRTLATTTGGAAAHDSFSAAGMAPRPPRLSHPTFVYPALILQSSRRALPRGAERVVMLLRASVSPEVFYALPEARPPTRQSGGEYQVIVVAFSPMLVRVVGRPRSILRLKFRSSSRSVGHSFISSATLSSPVWKGTSSAETRSLLGTR